MVLIQLQQPYKLTQPNTINSNSVTVTITMNSTFKTNTCYEEPLMSSTFLVEENNSLDAKNIVESQMDQPSNEYSHEDSGEDSDAVSDTDSSWETLQDSDIYSDEFTNCRTSEITVESEIEYTDWVREFQQPGRDDKVMNVIDKVADNGFWEDTTFGKNTTKTENEVMHILNDMFEILKILIVHMNYPVTE